MADLRPSDIDDLVNACLPELDRGKFNQIAQQYQNHEVMSQLMNQERVTMTGGDTVERDLMVRKSGTAKNVGLFEEDDVNVTALSEKITVPWRFTNVSWAYDLKEQQLNRGKSQIWNVVKMREEGAYVDLAELMEADFWGRLAATADTKKIFGIDYWINKSGSTAGFNGTDPTGFAGGAGGLPVATTANWKNYCAEFSNTTETDLIKKLRVAVRKCGYKPPRDIPDFRRGRGQRYRLYMNIDTITEMEDLGAAQNDNLGRNLASMDGVVTFRRFPLIWVPYLDSDAKDPVYGVDWSWFEMIVQKGSYMRRSMEKGKGHDIRNVFIDITWNTLTTNRRSHFVIEKA